MCPLYVRLRRTKPYILCPGAVDSESASPMKASTGAGEDDWAQIVGEPTSAREDSPECQNRRFSEEASPPGAPPPPQNSDDNEHNGGAGSYWVAGDPPERHSPAAPASTAQDDRGSSASS